MGGICDIAVANSYYVGLMRSGAGGPEQEKWGAAIKVILPTFAGGGTHVNVSGASIAKNSPNRAAAVRFLEYLVSAGGAEDLRGSQLRVPGEGRSRGSPDHRGARARSKSTRFRWPTSRVTARRRASWSTRSASTDNPQLMKRRPSRAGTGSWLAASGLLSLLVLAPLAALAFAAFRGSGDLWQHLIAFVLPVGVRDTLVLLAGVGLLAVDDRHRHGVAGHRLRLRRAPDRRLGAPAAARRSDLHHRVRLSRHPASGRVRCRRLSARCSASTVRAIPRLPDIRSMTGCIVLLGFVLYPVRLPHDAGDVSDAGRESHRRRAHARDEPARRVLQGGAAARPAGDRPSASPSRCSKRSTTSARRSSWGCAR